MVNDPPLLTSFFLFLLLSNPPPKTGTTKFQPIPKLVDLFLVLCRRQRRPPPSLPLLRVGGRRRQRAADLRRNSMLGVRHFGGVAYSGHHGRVADVAAGVEHLLGGFRARVRIPRRGRRSQRGGPAGRSRRPRVAASEAAPSTLSVIVVVVAGLRRFVTSSQLFIFLVTNEWRNKLERLSLAILYRLL